MNHLQPQITDLDLLATAQPYFGMFLDLYGTQDNENGFDVMTAAPTGTTLDMMEMLERIPGQLLRMSRDLDRKAYGAIGAIRYEMALDRGQYLAGA